MNFRIFLAFGLGLLSAFSLNVVGSLAYSELLLLCLLPTLPLILLKVVREREIRIYLLMGIAYFLSLVLSDLYRETVPADLLRGWSRVGITLISIVVFYSLISQGRNLAMAYIVGSLFASLVAVYQSGFNADIFFLYKFYAGTVVSAIAFIAMGLSGAISRKITRFLPVLAGVLAFAMNARALAGITFMAWLANIWTERMNRVVPGKTSGGRLGVSKWQFLLGAVGLALGALGIFSFYRTAASQGWLGQAALDKYEEQRRVSADGQFTLVSGRSEILFMWPKIIESPLIGYGSWAKDWNYVYDRAQAIGLNPEEISDNYVVSDPGVIPTHSHIFGAWLEAGLLGGIFWAFVFWRALQLLIRGEVAAWGRFSPLMVYILISFIWDLFFSPYGAERRMWDGFVIAAMAWIEANLRKGRESGQMRGPPIDPFAGAIVGGRARPQVRLRS